MRHPRRRHRKPVTHWVVRADARPTSVTWPRSSKVWTVGVGVKHVLPWTPARGRSKHWIEVRRA